MSGGRREESLFWTLPATVTQEPPLPADLPECLGAAGTAAIYH